MVQGVWEHPEGRKVWGFVQAAHSLHMVHEEAVVQQHSILVVNTFTSSD